MRRNFTGKESNDIYSDGQDYVNKNKNEDWLPVMMTLVQNYCTPNFPSGHAYIQASLEKPADILNQHQLDFVFTLDDIGFYGGKLTNPLINLEAIAKQIIHLRDDPNLTEGSLRYKCAFIDKGSRSSRLYDSIIKDSFAAICAIQQRKPAFSPLRSKM